MSVITRAACALLRAALGSSPAARGAIGDLIEEFDARPATLRRDVAFVAAAVHLALGYGLWRRLRRSGGRGTARRGRAGVMLDLRQAVRAVARRPTYTLAAVSTLALGIGADTALFSIVWHSLLRPLPWPAADRTLVLYDRPLDRPDAMSNMNVAGFLELRERSRAFDAMSAFEYSSHLVGGELDPADVRGMRVNAGFFEVLGLPPQLGRDFRPDEDRAGAARVVILSDGLWRERFGGEPDIIGRTVMIDLEPHVVVGIAAPDLQWRAAPRLWTPWAWDEEDRTDRRRRNIFAIGRVRPGVGIDAARAELATLSADIRTRFPEYNENRTIDGMPLMEWSVGWGRRFMRILGGAAALALLVACVNVVNLMLARAAGRRPELAMRRALGASRFQAGRVFLLEALILALAGAALGLLIATGGVRLITALYGASIPRADAVAVSLAPILFAAVTALGVTILVGLAPMLALDEAGGAPRLRGAGRGAVRRTDRLQSALVVLEVALGVVLVAAAGLLANTTARLGRVDLGVEPRGALSFRVSLPPARYAAGDDAIAFFDALTREIAAVPGVTAVGLSTRDPLSGGTNATFTTGTDPATGHLIEMRAVTPDWFDATGQRLVRGRMLDVADASPATAVLVNQALADALFAGDAVGRELRADSPTGRWTIAGVVSDVRDFGPAEPPRPTAYWPWGGDVLRSSSMAVLVRTSTSDPAALLPAVRDRLRTIDADLPLTGVATLESIAARTLGRERTASLVLIGAFAALALVLALLGIYAVIAFVVEERRREVGVRVALGATRAGILRMVCIRALRLSALGIAIGLIGAIAAGRTIAHLLWNVSPIDPATLGATAALFALAALAGALLPARRAASFDVADLLRHE